MDAKELKYNATHNMKAFTFYLDEITKKKACIKLIDSGLDAEQMKGTLSALIRVLLNEFVDMPLEDAKVIADKVEANRTFTLKKNKRSSM